MDHGAFMKSINGIGAAFIAAAALLIAASPAFADSITWQLRSFHPKPVNVKFHSQNRRAVWPGPDKSFTLADYKVGTFKLSCVAGEKICYGAAPSGNASKIWGVGLDGKAQCKDCCHTCGGDTKTKVMDLNDR